MITGRSAGRGYRSKGTNIGYQNALQAGVGKPAKISLLGVAERRPATQWLIDIAKRHRVIVQVLAFSPLIVVTVMAILFANRLQDLDTLGYFGILIVNAVGSGTFILPVPGLALVFAGAALWNPVLVALAGATGSAAGELTGYLAGVGSHTTVHRFMARRRFYLRIEEWMRRRGDLTIFILAAIPNPLFDMAGFASGSMGYPVQRFLLACWLGKAVKYLLVALAGYWGTPGMLRLFDL